LQGSKVWVKITEPNTAADRKGLVDFRYVLANTKVSVSRTAFLAAAEFNVGMQRMKREEQLRIDILKQTRSLGEAGGSLMYRNTNPMEVQIAKELIREGLVTGQDVEPGHVMITLIRDAGLEHLDAREKLLNFDKNKHVDIYSKGEVYSYIQGLQFLGQVKDCSQLHIVQGGTHGEYRASCEKDFLSWKKGGNVSTDMTGYRGPSSYSWPACPLECPKYQKTEDLLASLTESDAAEESTSIFDLYVNSSRIDELKKTRSDEFDLTKLIEMCQELNTCHAHQALLAIPALVRSILDHIPPIFKQPDFKNVTAQHGSQSFKEHMTHLDKSLRKIADSYLHTQIRKQESLPTSTQVDFKSDLDVLLQEVARVLKK
jgi:hypothetical protein